LACFMSLFGEAGGKQMARKCALARLWKVSPMNRPTRRGRGGRAGVSPAPRSWAAANKHVVCGTMFTCAPQRLAAAWTHPLITRARLA